MIKYWSLNTLIAYIGVWCVYLWDNTITQSFTFVVAIGVLSIYVIRGLFINTWKM